MPQRVLLAVRLDERDVLLVASRQAQVLERLVVHGEEPTGGAVLGRHVPDRRAICEGQPDKAVTEVLDELPHDTGLPQLLRDREDEVGRGGAFRERAREPEPDDLRHQHRHRLAEHRSLGFDAADAPAEHAEPVDHRRVRIRADERVGKRTSVTGLDHPREELEVDLVDDPRVRRNDLEVVERGLPPAQECVALAVALELELGVTEHRARGGVLVDLHRMVDHELGRKLRVDLRRVTAEVGHRVPHRRQVDDRRHAREVLEEHACRAERDLLRRLGFGLPAPERLGVGLLAVPERVLEQDPERVGEPFGALDPEDLVAAAAGAEGGRAHAVDCMERPAVPI